jgi:hypothetical protein
MASERLVAARHDPVAFAKIVAGLQPEQIELGFAAQFTGANSVAEVLQTT